METLTHQTLTFLETDDGSAVRIYAVNKLFIAQATSPRAANKVFCNFPFNLIMLFISVKRRGVIQASSK